MTKLSARVPDHPVYLRGLHSFAVWGNRLAFDKAGIMPATKAPTGGEIRKDAQGRPSGILLNNARQLLEAVIPPPTADQLDGHVRGALHALAGAGYVAIHEAGAGMALMESFDRLRGRAALPLRVYAMLSLRDHALVERWLASGPRNDPEGRLTVRSVKAFYDGALGSRGALLLADYADKPGHRGQGGAAYDFDADRLRKLLAAGFQASIHAIGDAGNREALNFLERTMEAASSRTRHRIEHAQILNPADMPRFGTLGVVASMQPSHAVEDMPWAEARVGPARIKGAYAWRTLRQAGARLLFNSDLPGTDSNIFYGLHSAITRRDKERKPDGGWYPAERMTPEEALRGFTTWAAYASFTEDVTGTIAPGRWADLTVMDIDPLVVGETAPDKLLAGQIRFTIVGGTVVYRTDR
jgi:predicted amidohydrolase YtcJ